MTERRLGTGDLETARELFAIMSGTFGEECARLGDEYLMTLLARDDFWAIAAFDGDAIVGGITAHTLPMTRAEIFEIMIYDIAVQPDRQRIGVGRLLMTALREAAARLGIVEIFVPSDGDDTHAHRFYESLGGSAAEVVVYSFPVSATDRENGV